MLFFLAACEKPVPYGRIRVRNDFRESKYIINVTAGNARFSLKPRQFALLPKGTTLIDFSHPYDNHIKTYTVSCPEKIGKGITIKMIDVYVNKIAGGCSTIAAGRR